MLVQERVFNQVVDKVVAAMRKIRIAAPSTASRRWGH